ncbi:Non-functional pseudokinase [Actinidia chinensis var. chinensis]|uniref:Non-functional pseudokinase n=1 Tax=Actinidia chinensis var. chinensis TaxID=1590841 RepID=A0A2R6Q651_ACTCC|nr:Non-functional pseudokinase [Actinidia chinensis var. chinensis]
MECVRGLVSSFLSSRREKHERYTSFVENRSKLQAEFNASWYGRYSTHIRNFSAEELNRATNNFDWQNYVYEDAYYILYRGSFGKHPILVKKYRWEIGSFSDRILACAVRDIAMTSQMSGHKNMMKLIGCCLEFKNPALVYDDVGSLQIFSYSLNKREGKIVQNGSLSWTERLSIANDIASAVVYLHTAFSTPILHRNLKLKEVMIDRCGVARLLDCSLCIAIPPGESQVEDAVVGTSGFPEPQYCLTGILTEKTDVYGFGMILLELVTGERSFVWQKDYVNKDRLDKIVDARIRGEAGGFEQELQLQAFVELALRCLGEEREYRPEMIDVAKELKRIQTLVHSSSAQP